MDAYLPIAGAIAVGAITPGPNNLVALNAGARGGLTAAVPPILGVVAGSLAMLALVAAGLDGPLSSPVARRAIAAAGAAWLAWSGIGLMRAVGTGTPSSLPAGALGVFAFQFANPKAWLLATSVAVAAPSRGAALFALFALIPAACLAAWAGAGAMLRRLFDDPARRRRIDRANGLLLLAFAAWLAFDAFAAGGAP